MDIQIIQFKELAQSASKELKQSYYHAPSIVPFMAKMIKLTEENPELKSKFIDAIIELWGSCEYEHEIFEFCCHALRWDELKRYFSTKLAESINNDLRAWHVLSDIVESFNPDWEDAIDFYGEYFDN